MKLNFKRMHERIAHLAEIGKTPEGGSRRIALTDEDKLGRDLLVSWMRETGLDVKIDEVGNIFGILKGSDSDKPIMLGSHIDTVGNGGHFDGCYGVIAGLEVIATFFESKITPKHDLCVAIFTNEEGVRFQPDMMGSLVYAGGLSVTDAHDTVSNEGKVLIEELIKINYLGDMKCGSIIPHAFLELHIEQGPILDKGSLNVGVVENIQGISWTEVKFIGQANHAGTTPMNMRKDAGFAASKLAVAVREITESIGNDQVGTVGMITPKPNLINVVPAEVTMTVDLRNSDEEKLKAAEFLLQEVIDYISVEEGVEVETNQLVRFEPVIFDNRIIDMLDSLADEKRLTYRRMKSGAGHDAQMLARICPAAMIFVPSKNGVSHNPKEFTSEKDLNIGAGLLLDAVTLLDDLSLD